MKRHETLVPLSRDHHHGLLLCWKIRKGMQNETETGKIADYVLYFYDEHLREHFHEEEKYIFSHLAQDDVHCKKAYAQHKRLNRLFDQLRDKSEQVNTLWKIEEELEAHIRFEERTLFPYIEQKLSPHTLAEIGVKLDEIHEPFQECWSNEFWKD